MSYDLRLLHANEAKNGVEIEICYSYGFGEAAACYARFEVQVEYLGVQCYHEGTLLLKYLVPRTTWLSVSRVLINMFQSLLLWIEPTCYYIVMLRRLCGYS